MMQLIQQWETSTTCIGQSLSFQTFIRKYIGCPGIKNEVASKASEVWKIAEKGRLWSSIPAASFKDLLDFIMNSEEEFQVALF